LNFNGQTITSFDKQAMRPLRKQLQIVFQDPFGSLSPRMTAGQL
jgi:ABC-type microcin C transport system duplicated ATPase subunit YejF